MRFNTAIGSFGICVALAVIAAKLAAPSKEPQDPFSLTPSSGQSDVAESPPSVARMAPEPIAAVERAAGSTREVPSLLPAPASLEASQPLSTELLAETVDGFLADAGFSLAPVAEIPSDVMREVQALLQSHRSEYARIDELTIPIRDRLFDQKLERGDFERVDLRARGATELMRQQSDGEIVSLRSPQAPQTSETEFLLVRYRASDDAELALLIAERGALRTDTQQRLTQLLHPAWLRRGSKRPGR